MKTILLALTFSFSLANISNAYPRYYHLNNYRNWFFSSYVDYKISSCDYSQRCKWWAEENKDDSIFTETNKVTRMNRKWINTNTQFLQESLLDETYFK